MPGLDLQPLPPQLRGHLGGCEGKGLSLESPGPGARGGAEDGRWGLQWVCLPLGCRHWEGSAHVGTCSEPASCSEQTLLDQAELFPHEGHWGPGTLGHPSDLEACVLQVHAPSTP